MRKHILTQAILLALGGAMLTGCGSDEDSDSSSSNESSNVAPAPNVAITASNAKQKAQEAFGISVVAGSMLQIASTNGAVQDGYRITLKDVAMTAFKHIRRQAATASADRVVTAQATDSETETCDYGGTATYTYIDQDGNPETLQAGDGYTVIFSSCKDDDFGEIAEVNGKMVFTLTKIGKIFELSSDDEVFDADARIETQNLSFKISSDYAVINGTFDASINNSSYDASNNFISDVTTTLKSDKFQIEHGSDKGTIYALDYAMHTDYTSGAWWFSQANVLDVNGEVIRVETTPRFDGQGCNYPYQGSGMIYGYNSSVKVTAQPNNMTVLDIDTDGNGTVDVIQQFGSDEVFSVFCGID